MGVICVLVGLETAQQLCEDGIKLRITDFVSAWTRGFTGSIRGQSPSDGDLRYRKHHFGDPNYKVRGARP